MGYQPIENYGIIGDLHTIALVGMDGSVDFMCFPEFDSPSVFAALLDHRKGGRFQIAPVLGGANHKQLYLPDTNVLLTRFLSKDGVAEVSDFMPVGATGGAHRLIRRVKTVRGDICYRVVCDPHFDYARAKHRVEKKDGEVVFMSEGPDRTALRLRTSAPLRLSNGAATGEFTLRTGESAAFVLEDASSGEDAASASPDYVSRSFKDTVNFWRGWAARSSYQGRWRETVTRSALTLKLLTSEQHGSIIAAPTFGLPEEIGGERNWDYRYCWLRDAFFVVRALNSLGAVHTMENYFGWLTNIVARAESNHLQPVYGIGEIEPPETSGSTAESLLPVSVVR